MHSRFMFKENGRVIRTRSSARDAAWVMLVLAALVALLGWGHAVDEAARDGAAYDAGQMVERLQMQDAVAAAYRQGQVDAVVACHADGAAP